MEILNKYTEMGVLVSQAWAGADLPQAVLSGNPSEYLHCPCLDSMHVTLPLYFTTQLQGQDLKIFQDARYFKDISLHQIQKKLLEIISLIRIHCYK